MGPWQGVLWGFGHAPCSIMAELSVVWNQGAGLGEDGGGGGG